jgi:hypothetical protein
MKEKRRIKKSTTTMAMTMAATMAATRAFSKMNTTRVKRSTIVT